MKQDGVYPGDDRRADPQHAYNPFDLTKVWYKGEFPLIEVGVLELNRNPDNYFQDVEQAAFTPAEVVPGIGFSPDKMLQGRLFPTATPTATAWDGSVCPCIASSFWIGFNG